MSAKPILKPEASLDRAVTALRSQRRRHLEALAEIDEALRQLGMPAVDAADSADDPDFVAALERVNERYGTALSRLA